MSRHTLRTLIRLAQDRTDTAVRQLGRLTGQEQAIEERLRQLTAYRTQYQARLMASVREGLPRAALQNYRSFLGALDQAIAQCREQLAAARVRRQAGLAQLCREQRALQSFQVLEKRLRHKERSETARAEQRRLDEWATRSAALPWADPSE